MKKCEKIFLYSLCFAFVLCMSGLVNMDRIAKPYEQREVNAQISDETKIVPGGFPIGIYMETDGVMVLGTETIKGMDGMKKSPAKHLLKPGDYIVEMNDEPIKNKKQLIEKMKHLTEKEVALKVRRGNDVLDVQVKPQQVGASSYQLGIWVRDNIQGLGTVTFIKKDGTFGALGHGIHDVDTNALIDLSKGRLYETDIRAIQKGQRGTPGGLEGIIVYNTYHILGKIEKNTDAGIFGEIRQDYYERGRQEAMEIEKKENIVPGKAIIRCMVDGTVREYDVNIVKVDLHCKEINKGILIEVTDPKLLSITGGIIQGMSGSPILQNGKIVGAVTHVLVNDPTRGYGIFIENMLEQ